MLENKYEDKLEEETKSKELKDIIDQVKIDIEIDRNSELEEIKLKRDILEKVKEATKGMGEKERQNEIERVYELEKQREIERQR